MNEMTLRQGFGQLSAKCTDRYQLTAVYIKYASLSPNLEKLWIKSYRKRRIGCIGTNLVSIGTGSTVDNVF